MADLQLPSQLCKFLSARLQQGVQFQFLLLHCRITRGEHRLHRFHCSLGSLILRAGASRRQNLIETALNAR